MFYAPGCVASKNGILAARARHGGRDVVPDMCAWFKTNSMRKLVVMHREGFESRRSNSRTAIAGVTLVAGIAAGLVCRSVVNGSMFA
ncbi:MAG: hypothetical protein CBHOC_1019 [uncultured Caballeronia sp.]|nr:MAG: hypothetical protein CBHOC_1019 [uncultured Caballeronia sp.]